MELGRVGAYRTCPVLDCSCSGCRLPTSCPGRCPPRHSSPNSHPRAPLARPFLASGCCFSLGLITQAASLQKCSGGCVSAHVSPQVWKGYLQRKRTQQDRRTEMEFIGMVSPRLTPGRSSSRASAWGPSPLFCPSVPPIQLLTAHTSLRSGLCLA